MTEADEAQESNTIEARVEGQRLDLPPKPRPDSRKPCAVRIDVLRKACAK